MLRKGVNNGVVKRGNDKDKGIENQDLKKQIDGLEKEKM